MSCENCQTCISDAITIQPKNAVFNVTDACNFRCPYCFVEHNPRRATLEIAEKVCQYLLNAPNEGDLLFGSLAESQCWSSIQSLSRLLKNIPIK